MTFYISTLRFNLTFYLPFRRTCVHPRFLVGSCYSIFSFICMLCWSLFVLLYFFFWSLCCLFFFDLWILITPLVSSKKNVKIWRKKQTLLMADSCSWTWWILEGLVWYSYGIYQPQQSLNVQDICCCNQRQYKILTCVPHLF